MQKRKIRIGRTLSLLICSVTLIIIFQNCGAGFKAQQYLDLSSTGDLGNTAPTPTPTLTPTPTPLPTATPTPAPTPTPVPGNALMTCPQSVVSSLTATANLSQRFQAMDGFGFSQRAFDDPHVTETFNAATKRAAAIPSAADQAQIHKLLYQDMGFNMVRPINEGAMEATNDNSDPDLTDLSKFDFSWKANDVYIDYIKQVAPLGVKNYWLSPVTLESWMSEATPAEHAEWSMAVLTRWKNQGVELPYYSIINEPSYPRSGIRSGQYMRDVIKILGPKMRLAGMKTKLVITDDVRASDTAAKSRVILEDAEARQFVGAIATHLYDEPFSNMEAVKALGAQYNLPIWMTEFSLIAMGGNYVAWGQLMHDLISNYNVSAVMYMWGFFGQWDGDRSMLIQINNSGSTYTGFTPQKALYAMGQYAKFLPQGTVRTAVSYPDVGGTKISSYSVGNKTVFVVVNPGAAKKIDLAVAGRTFRNMYSATATSPTQNMSALPAGCARGNSAIFDLPSESVSTYELEF